MTRIRISFIMAFVVVAAIPAGAVSAQDADSEVAQHCATRAEGVSKTGEIQTGLVACFATLEEAYEYLGATPEQAADQVDEIARGASQLSVLAVTTFYEPAAFSGTSFSVSFACGSGYLNFQNFLFPGGGNWDNKTSAVTSSCSYIRLFYLQNMGGSMYQVNGSGTLTGTGMDNQASSACIQC